MDTEIRTVAVLGSGTMGNGIAQVCATHGLEVRMQDVEESFLQRGRAAIRTSLERLAKKGRVATDDLDAIQGRITSVVDRHEAVDGVDLVVEAVPEDLELKLELFADLDRSTPDHTILASNTSNFSVTAIAAATDRPDRVIGMHWFNPAPVMRLIEIVRGHDTSDQTIAAIEHVSARLGKETVVCKDAQGFITTRAVIALTCEALRMLEEGVASKEDIDKAIRLGLNHPMGPLELGDLTGLDTTLHVADAMSQAYGNRFLPTNTLRNLVRAGHHGRKSGRGVYDYR